MKRISIKPGVVRFDTLDENVNDYDWNELDICFTMSFRRNIEVMYSDQHPDYGIIIKPKKIYMSSEFENIFGLGLGGEGYHPDIIVGVRNYEDIV